MGSKAIMQGVGKSARRAPNQTSSTRALTMLTGYAPAPIKKQVDSPAPAPAQRSGLYDPKTKSNFEEEIKKRRKNPTGGTMGGTGGGYGGNTQLG
jgi:hypothetical protein